MILGWIIFRMNLNKTKSDYKQISLIDFMLFWHSFVWSSHILGVHEAIMMWWLSVEQRDDGTKWRREVSSDAVRSAGVSAGWRSSGSDVPLLWSSHVKRAQYGVYSHRSLHSSGDQTVSVTGRPVSASGAAHHHKTAQSGSKTGFRWMSGKQWFNHHIVQVRRTLIDCKSLLLDKKLQMMLNVLSEGAKREPRVFFCVSDGCCLICHNPSLMRTWKRSNSCLVKRCHARNWMRTW